MTAMTTPGSFDHLQRAALAMLADGNGADAVSQLLDVPLETLQAWQVSAGRPPVPDAVASPEAGPASPAPLPDTRAPQRFRDELVHAEPASDRMVVLAGAVLLAIGGAALARWAARGAVSDGANVLLLVLPMAFGLARMAQRHLVLGPHRAVVPGLFVGQSMAYADIASYSLERRSWQRGDGSTGFARTLTLHSRRPHARPLVANIPGDTAIDPRLLKRLASVVEFNRHAPLPAVAAGQPGGLSALLARLGWLPVVAAWGLALLEVWPMLSHDLRALAQPGATGRGIAVGLAGVLVALAIFGVLAWASVMQVGLVGRGQGDAADDGHA